MKGKTTRIIDRAIQQYFDKGFAFVYDERRTNIKNHHVRVLRIFINRIMSEHNLKRDINYKADYICESGIMCYKITKL